MVREEDSLLRVPRWPSGYRHQRSERLRVQEYRHLPCLYSFEVPQQPSVVAAYISRVLNLMLFPLDGEVLAFPEDENCCVDISLVVLCVNIRAFSRWDGMAAVNAVVVVVVLLGGANKFK